MEYFIMKKGTSYCENTAAMNMYAPNSIALRIIKTSLGNQQKYWQQGINFVSLSPSRSASC
jgi:hypothetical protein